MNFVEHETLSGHLEFLKEGDSYLKTVKNSGKRPEVFTPEIVFNMLGMAIEKLMMATLTYCGCLPENHTFHDLADAWRAAVGDMAPERKRLLESLDSHNNLCSLDAFHQRIPTPEVMAEFVGLAEDLQREAHARILVPHVIGLPKD
ncbi:MAG: hypothetical protein RL318_1449 [Fibrobacterota bacterium]|jgi:hypothetical protein